MPSVIVVGAQWGDEGKGKVVDLLSSEADLVVRAQGGNNAGHTVIVGQEEYKLHLIPSGILHPNVQCFIAAGTVLDPKVLLEEIRMLESRGILLQGRLFISSSAHVIFPYHREIDLLLEKRKGARTVGTTGRGIGPCYADKADRLGIRMGELVRPNLFASLLKDVLPLKNETLVLFGASALSLDDLYKEYSQYAEALKPYVRDLEIDLHTFLENDAKVLFEGAQGTFLDTTHGTYPYVTSSSTLAAGICAGAGVGPSKMTHTLGVIKAYTTRVGQGAMPTENAELDVFFDHTKAREFGTTTGRKRRVGWFDGVLARTAVRLNGLQSLAVTKLDILDQFDQIKLCIAYKLNGKQLNYVPSLEEDLRALTPIYETMAGWKESTSGITSYEQLPSNARAYLERISQLCDTPISLISLGPERENTLLLKNPFCIKSSVC